MNPGSSFRLNKGSLSPKFNELLLAQPTTCRNQHRAIVWHNFSRKPASHLDKLITLDPFHMGCVRLWGSRFILSRTDSYSRFEFAFPLHSSPRGATTRYCLKPMDPCYCKGVAHDHENHWSHHVNLTTQKQTV